MAKIWKIQPSPAYRKALRFGRVGVTPELDVWTETPLNIGRLGVRIFINHPYYKGGWLMIKEQVGKKSGLSARMNLIRLKGVKYVDTGQKVDGVPLDTTKGGHLSSNPNILNLQVSKVGVGRRKGAIVTPPVSEPVSSEEEITIPLQESLREEKILGMPQGLAIGLGLALLVGTGVAIWQYRKKRGKAS